MDSSRKTLLNLTNNDRNRKDSTWFELTTPPRLPRYTLAREAVNILFDRLSEYPVVTLSAPAGFSKTVSLLMWLDARELNYTWFAPTESYVELEFLQRWFEQAHQPILVIDDAHLLSPACWHFIDKHISLLSHQRLFILSRSPASLNLSAMKAEGLVASVGIQELQFVEAESKALCQLRQIEPEVCQLMPESIVAWPAAVQLWLSAALRFGAEVVQQPQWLFDLQVFLEQEWLADLSEAQKEVLVFLALSNASTVELFKQTNYVKAIGDFVEQGVIELHSSTHNDCCLSTGIKRIILGFPSSFFKPYHRKLGELNRQLNHQAEALRHFILAEESDACFELLKRSGWLLFQQGHLGLLADATAIISKDHLLPFPSLCFLRAELLLYRDEAKQADGWINECEQQWFTQGSLNEDSELAIDAYKTTIAVVFEDYAAAMHWGQSAISHFRGRLHWEYGKALVSLAEACFYRGELLLAEQYAREAESVAISNHMFPLLASARYWLAQLMWQRCDYEDAFSTLQYTSQELQSNPLLNEWRLDFVHRLLVSFARQTGRETLAEEVFRAHGQPEIERGGFWALPWMTEALLIELNQAAPVEQKIESYLAIIEQHLACFRVAMVWRLNAELACTLASSFLQDHRRLKLRRGRELSLTQGSCVLLWQERFCLSLVWFGLHERGRAAAVVQDIRHLAASKYLLHYTELLEALVGSAKTSESVLGYWQRLFERCLPTSVSVSARVVATAAASDDPLALQVQQLTPTEKRVFLRFSQGGSNESMAEALGIAVSTLRSHIKAINKKLGCSKRAQLRDLAERFVGQETVSN